MKTYKFTINGNKYSVEVGDIEDSLAHVEVNGTPYLVEMDTELKIPVKKKPVVKIAAVAAVGDTKSGTTTASVGQAPKAVTASGATLKAPLPGVVLDVFVRTGDTVKTGQRVLLLEAMKMENNIDSDRDGVIKEIKVQPNDSVMEGDVLIVFE